MKTWIALFWQMKFQVRTPETNTVFEVDPSDLWMIDAGAYTKQFTFDIKEFVGR